MITAKTSRGMCSELYGLSTDTKPIDVTNASTFFEMDTSTLYIFDADSQEWYEVLSSAGAIRYDEAMELSDAEMKQARDNISAAFGKKLVYLNMLYDDIVTDSYVVSLGQFRPEEIEIKDWFFTVDFHIGKITAISNNDVTVQLTSQSLTDYFVTRSITLKVDAVESQPEDSVDIWLASTNGNSIVEMLGTQSQDVTLRGVATPSVDNDAANKAYVDAQSGSVAPAAVVDAIDNMTDEQVEDARGGLAAEPQKLVVYLTESGGIYSASRTVADIYAAYEAGITCVLEYDYRIYPLTYIESNHVEFSLAFYNNTNWKIHSFTGHDYNPPEEWTFRYIFVEAETKRETVSGTTPSIEPRNKTIYECGTLTSLTISSPSLGPWSVVFTSGATATTTTFPNTLLGLEDFAAEANTRYEINVLDDRAVVGKWAVSST